MSTTPLAIHGPYAITPSYALSTEALLRQVEACLRGGIRWLQYRDKSTDTQRRQRQASALVKLCHRYQARCIINDDISLAISSHADGVHLGKSDGDTTNARRHLGKQRIIGISCYNQLSLAHQAQNAGANYVAFGRFFTSGNKPLAVQAETAILSIAHRELKLPIVAIGGINIDNGKSLVMAGADSLAVIQAVFSGPQANAETIQQTAQQLCQLFPTSH